MIEVVTIETRYAESGDVYIAYQISGLDGPDLLAAPGYVSHLEHFWEEPTFARFHHALGAFSRLIRFDKRGTGLSDRSVGIPESGPAHGRHPRSARCSGLEEGFSVRNIRGWPDVDLFAATYPERVAGLILAASYARSVGPSVARDDPRMTERRIRANWGTGKSVAGFSPSRAGDQSYVDWFAKLERLSASPSDVIHLQRMNREIDVRHMLPAIRVPTLVIHRRDDVRVRVSAGPLSLPGASPMRAMSSCPAPIMFPGAATGIRWSRRSGLS